jgi:hypothetical protein
LPHWEFVIKLSGADLPLRSPQDLGLLLAPYRGRSLATFFRVKNSSPSATSLQLDVWSVLFGPIKDLLLDPIDKIYSFMYNLSEK